MSGRCTELVREVDVIFVDATYYTCPSVGSVYQVLTLVTIWSHTIIPLAWCLMERKTQCAYVAVFALLRSCIVTWEFTKAICDFEDALINALVIVFAVQVQGCLFHSTNAMSSWARTNLSVPIIAYFPEVQEVIRLCCTLPLLPQHLLQRGFNAICDAALNLGFLYGIVRPFLLYVQVEWLDHPNRGRTMSVFGSFNRTNNASESNNRRMKRRIGTHHPNIFSFIRHLTNFEDTAMDDIESLTQGLTPSRHRSVSSVIQDQVIRRLSLQLTQNPNPSDADLLQFLSEASHCVERAMLEALGLWPPPNQN